VRKIALLAAFAASLFGAEPSYEVIETIKKGDAAKLKTLISDSDNANASIAGNKTILMLSVWEQKLEIASILIEKGADVNAKDASGKTPLMLAVWKENLPLVKLLISKGADKSAKNNEGLSAADVAELTGNGDIIDFLRADFMK
jgi:hypothetical protein